MISQHFYLHITPDTIKPKVYVNQHDAGLSKLNFTLVDQNSYYIIPEDTRITLVGTKPDNKAFSYACVYSESTITSDISEQMTAVPGIVECEIRMDDKHGNRLGTINFEIEVERSPLQNSVCSINDFKSVDDTIRDIHQDALNAKAYALRAEEAVASIDDKVEDAIVRIDSEKDAALAELDTVSAEAISTVNDIKTETVQEIEAVAESATAEIEENRKVVLEEFEKDMQIIHEYVEHPVIYEYIEATQSLRMSSLD